MENLSTKLQEQEQFNQESFSFSSFDFNSSLGIFTDDDDDDDDGDDEPENDEAYIEITLEQEQEQEQTVPPNSSSTRGRGDDLGNDMELLHVSFSSSVPFPGFSCSSANDSSRCYSSMITSSFSSSSANVERQTETGGSDVLCSNGGSNRGKMGFTAWNRLVDVLLSTLKLKGFSSASAAVPLGNQNGRQPEKKGSWELVQSRKAPSIVNGGARKLLIEFKSLNISSMVASFVKPRHRQVIASSQLIINNNNNNKNKRRTTHEEAITPPPPPRTCPMPSNSQSQRNISRRLKGKKSYPNLGGSRKGENWRLLEMNLEGIRKMVEAVGKIKMFGGRGGKRKESKSCPGSVKSSPIHKERWVGSTDENKIYTRDNSLQAAIAHCKQSFAQSMQL